MDQFVISVLTECTRASDDERITFGEVVMKLAAAGVERYRADLVRAEKIYYLPSGQSHVVACKPLVAPPSHSFSAAGVEAAVRTIQAGAIKYGAFCEQIANAGCVDYIVSLSGRQAIYFGRTGASHVEPFPGTP